MNAPLIYSDDAIGRILRDVETIAVVGASPNRNQPSHFTMKYMREKGYRTIPVNPRAAGQEILGETVHASLAEVPGAIDMVQIFRNSKAAGRIADDAVAVAAEKGIKVIWMQLGVRDDAAAARAEAAGLEVIMDRCPKIEFGRLNREPSRIGRWPGR